jgi:putative ABC transport system permease protein
MLRNYFKIALRKLVKDRQFTILNLVGLSTALACTFMIYLWVNDDLNVDKFNENDKHLYRVLYNISLENEILTLEQTPSLLAEALRAEIPEVENAVSVNYFENGFFGAGLATHGEKSMKVQGAFASKELFNVFSYHLIEGTKESALAKKTGVVISEKLAKNLYNTTENLIGKPLNWTHKLDLKNPLTISGVFQDLPVSATNQFDIVFSYDLLKEIIPNINDWRGTYARTYLALKKGTDIGQFNNKIRNFPKAKHEANSKCTLLTVPYSDKHLYGNFENGVQASGRIEYVKLFSFIAFFILIIACINFVNLTTAQASKKAKEIGVKKTLGASQSSLIFQYLGESFLLISLSTIISITFVALLLPAFNSLSHKQIALSFNANTLLAISTIILITTFFSGIYPALYLSKFNPITVLKGKLSTTFGELFVRKGLVIFQFGMSIIFIVGFIVIKKQIDFIQTQNLGYNRNNIISVQREGSFFEKSEPFLAELRNLPNVERVSTMPKSILDGNDNQSGFSWNSQKSNENFSFKSPRISYDAIETLGIQILQGRSYSSTFKDDDKRIIINESAQKKMQIQNPIGKTIMQGETSYEIIGVAKDFQYGSIHQKIEPLIFRFRPEAFGENVLVKIKAGSDKIVIKNIKTVYEKFHHQYPFEYSYLDADYQKLYASEQIIGVLSNFFAGLAILISCLGLFGLVTFSVQNRQKEIGIRKVLGSTIAEATVLLSKDFLKLVIIAIIISCPIAYYLMQNWLQDFAYKIDFQWWFFAIAGLSAIGIALLTVSYQAIKAAMMNPVKSLKTE